MEFYLYVFLGEYHRYSVRRNRRISHHKNQCQSEEVLIDNLCLPLHHAFLDLSNILAELLPES